MRHAFTHHLRGARVPAGLAGDVHDNRRQPLGVRSERECLRRPDAESQPVEIPRRDRLERD